MGANAASHELYAGANKTATEALSSMRVIHSYNLQEYISNMYSADISAIIEAAKRKAGVSGLAFGYSQFMQFGMYSLIIYFAGHEVRAPNGPAAVSELSCGCTATQHGLS